MNFTHLFWFWIIYCIFGLEGIIEMAIVLFIIVIMAYLMGILIEILEKITGRKFH